MMEAVSTSETSVNIPEVHPRRLQTSKGEEFKSLYKPKKLIKNI
jgi:hypothetical protein